MEHPNNKRTRAAPALPATSQPARINSVHGLCTKPLLPRALPGQTTSAGKSGAHAGPLEPGARGPRRNSRTKRTRRLATTLHTWRQQQTIDNNIGQTPAHMVAIGNRSASAKGTTRSSSDAMGCAGAALRGRELRHGRRRLRSFLALDGRVRNRAISGQGAGAPRARRSSFRGALMPPTAT